MILIEKSTCHFSPDICPHDLHWSSWNGAYSHMYISYAYWPLTSLLHWFAFDSVQQVMGIYLAFLSIQMAWKWLIIMRYIYILQARYHDTPTYQPFVVRWFARCLYHSLFGKGKQTLMICIFVEMSLIMSSCTQILM